VILLNGNEISPTIFPDNTSQVWNIQEYLTPYGRDVITFDFESEEEIFWLYQLAHLIHNQSSCAILKMDYLPYARQDKGVSDFTTFALYSFAKIINQMNFHEVHCVDPHSPVSDIIRNLKVSYPLVEVMTAFKGFDIACYPDKGAIDKYLPIYGLPSVCATKIRDQRTGEILTTTFNDNVLNKKILIIDDICDGGRTFIGLAKVLYNKGASSVGLFVTHGLFTKGIEVLKDAVISHIGYYHKKINGRWLKQEN
jgi:ribose-phosphate pyrophosphokinase